MGGRSAIARAKVRYRPCFANCMSNSMDYYAESATHVTTHENNSVTKQLEHTAMYMYVVSRVFYRAAAEQRRSFYEQSHRPSICKSVCLSNAWIV